MSPSTTDPAAADHRTALGVGLLVLGAFLFSIQDAVIKSMSGDYSVFQISFVRSIVGLPLVLVLWRALTDEPDLRTRQPRLHAARVVLMFSAYTSFYVSLAAMPLAVAVAIAFSAPLFILLFSVVLFGDQVGVFRWAAVLVGFLGVVAVVRPGAEAFEPAALLAVVCAICYAGGAMLARHLGVADSGAKMAVYGTGGYFLFSATALLLAPLAETAAHPSLAFATRPWITPSWGDLGLMAGTGVIAAIGFYCLAEAYRVGRSSVVAPFEYTGMMWAVLWGVVFFGEALDSWTTFGVVLIVGSGLFILRRERVRRAPILSRRGRFRV